MNADVRRTFRMRSKVISLTRRFFEEKGFLEVETQMMHPIAVGANAKPFVTHHNALSIDRYLRIAPELYLKRLIVGGFEAVFEINRNFRNEGMDATHNPEFTSIEFYWAFKTYKDLIAITKEYFAYLFKHLDLPTVLKRNLSTRRSSRCTLLRSRHWHVVMMRIRNLQTDLNCLLPDVRSPMLSQS
jgi:lysyl-tRNA synthetase class 2